MGKNKDDIYDFSRSLDDDVDEDDDFPYYNAVAEQDVV